MRKHFFIYQVFLLFVFLSFNVNAQKKDYKDISPLVISRQYKIAKPLLIELLKEHPDFPVANLYAGKIYQDIYSYYDFVADSAGFCQYYDSAIYHYKKYKDLGNEKDIRKHDDFYKEFYRRDLRTGEYDIKLSDIIVEIDQSIDKMDAHKKEVEDLLNYQFEIETEYSDILRKVKQKISTFSDYKELILLEDSTLMPDFLELISQYDRNLEKRKLASNRVIILGQKQYANTSADIKTQELDVIKKFKFPGLFTNSNSYFPDLGNFMRIAIKDLGKVLNAKKVLYSAFENEISEVKDITNAQAILNEFNENGLISSLVKYKIHDRKINNSFKANIFDSLSSRQIIPLLQDYIVVLTESKILLSEVKTRNTDFERSIHLNFIYREFYGKVEFNKWIKNNLSSIENRIDSLNAEIEKHYFKSKYIVHDSDTFPVFSENEVSNKNIIHNYNNEGRIVSLGTFFTQDSLSSQGIFIIDSDSLLSDFRLNKKLFNDTIASKLDNISLSLSEKSFYKEGTAFVYLLESKDDNHQMVLKIIYNTDPLLEPIECKIIGKDDYKENEVNEKKVQEKPSGYGMLKK